MIFKTDSIELSYGKTTILNSVYLKAETGKITGYLVETEVEKAACSM